MDFGWLQCVNELHSWLKKNMPLMSNVDNEGVCQCAGAGDLRETSVPSSQFCYKPKTALKTCLQKKKKKEIRDYGAKNNKKGKKA